MDSAKATPKPERSHDDETKRRLLLEYDAANYRDRHDLLDRENISVRDIARWRRETALSMVSDGTSDPGFVPVRATPRSAPRPTGKHGKHAAPPPEPAAAATEPTATEDTDATAPAPQPERRGRRRGRAGAETGASSGPLSALRSDVVAAHASALVYHADALSRLASESSAIAGTNRRRSAPLERLVAAANETKLAAREVLSGRRRAAAADSAARDSVDVSAELTDMLSKLTDYPSLAVAVELLARELEPSDATRPSARTRTPRNRRRWWAPEEQNGGVEAELTRPNRWAGRGGTAS
jgi:hypothetical protein